MTQIELAKKGIISEEVKKISKKEGIEEEIIRRRIANGRIVIFKNEDKDVEPVGVGYGLRVKINANVGTSSDYVNIEEELEKARIAIKYGADTIMDLSTGGDLDYIRKLFSKFKIPLGSVPIYQSAVETLNRGRSIVDMDEDDIFKAIEKHAKDVDFYTIHAGITREALDKLIKSKRIAGIVSRGGAFLAAYMLHNDVENPLYKNFDYILEISREYDVVISLGDALRPGSVADASDAAQIQELIVLGELVERARENNVQVIVEGPGHVPLNEIEANVKLQKKICRGAPFYVLGPIVTDIAPGYDHITGAIGAAIAAYSGADFICYVTPAEHLALPTVEDVKLGVIAAKIAAHAADIAKGRDMEWDIEISKARAKLDWEKQFKLCIDKEKAMEYRKKRAPKVHDTCTMCGKYCAMKLVRGYVSLKND